MSSILLGPRAAALPASAPVAAKLLLQLLARLRHGSLDLEFPDGSTARFGSGSGRRASLRLHDWSVCAATLRAGDIGFAESFIAGHWSSPDLARLLELLALNRDGIERAVYGSAWGSLLYRLRHLARRNTRAGSRRNVHAHYDLGNEFYALWLDETMNYSSACFDGDASRSLADAQRAKLARVFDQCGLAPGERLLEIGCGWGALAQHAAERGAQVTGLTLSTEQLDFATRRLHDVGLADRAELRLQDYRDIADGPFDAVASVEMFEAVGREYWPGFFAMLMRQLKPGGRACIQSITIRDDLFDRYVRSTDFIQQYIFPGGLLPSRAAFRDAARRAGLELQEEHAFGADYARTLHCWRDRFLAREREVRALGFDTRFMRIWEFYLAYCEAAFASGNTDVVQFTLRRPPNR